MRAVPNAVATRGRAPYLLCDQLGISYVLTYIFPDMAVRASDNPLMKRLRYTSQTLLIRLLGNSFGG